MKQIVLIFSILMLSFMMTAQVPAGFSYQAVVRNSSGDIITGQTIKFRFSILPTSPSGTPVYVETQSGSTNDFGLVNLKIGMGTPVTGVFTTIAWGEHPYYLKVEMDPENGNTFTHLGTTQLLAVPYALHAQSAENLSGTISETDPKGVTSASVAGTNTKVLTITLNDASMVNAQFTDMVGEAGSGDNWGADYVHTDATLEGQGTTALPLKIAQQTATTGQVLKWSGTTWAPAADNIGEGGSSPTGTAGGDLTGTYPNPTIGDMKVTSAKIQDGTIKTEDLAGDIITTWKIVNGAVTGDKIANGAVTGDKIAQAGAVNGQILKWNGAAWSPGNDDTGSSLWLQNGNHMYYDSGFIGIGTANPETPLEVASSGIPIIKLNNTSTNVGNVQKITFWKGSTEKFAIGYDLWGTGDNLFTLFDTPSLLPVFNIKNGNAGIGTTDPGAKLEVAGQVKITGGSPGEGKVLTSDATGFATWQTPVSSGLTLPYSGTITHGDWILKIKNESTTAAGGICGEGLNGIWGRGNVDMSGAGVIGNGYFGIAGEGTYCGVSGSTYNTTGGMGVRGYARATSGECYGVHGKSDSSTGVGVYGEGKTAIRAVTSKNQGYGIHISCTDATSVTRGVYSSISSPTGYSGYFSGGRFHVGGNVGIGTVSPSYRLVVLAPNKESTGIAGFYNSESDPKVLIRQTTNGCGQINVYNNSEATTITLLGDGDSFINGGDLGLGTESPNYKLDVRGTIGNNTTLYHSDRRWKTDIRPVQYGIQDLMKLNGVSYLWNVADYPDMGFDQNVQFGFIAQEFEKIIPELVTTDKEGFKSIDYVKITPLLVKAIQQQQKLLERMKTENDLLKERLEKLELLVGASAKN